MYICLITHKVYIGQTNKAKLIYRSGPNGEQYIKGNPESHFARAIIKYGWNNFIPVKLVTGIKTQEEANRLETIYIKRYNSVNNGYNSNYGGNAKSEISEETRNKISNNSKQMWANGGIDFRKKYKTQEHRQKLSEAQKKSYSEHPEIKEKLAKARKNKCYVCNAEGWYTIEKIELSQYIANGYFPGKVWVSKERQQQIINDFNTNKKISCHDLTKKYHLDEKIIRRVFEFNNAILENRSHLAYSKNKGD